MDGTDQDISHELSILLHRSGGVEPRIPLLPRTIDRLLNRNVPSRKQSLLRSSSARHGDHRQVRRARRHGSNAEGRPSVSSHSTCSRTGGKRRTASARRSFPTNSFSLNAVKIHHYLPSFGSPRSILFCCWSHQKKTRFVEFGIRGMKSTSTIRLISVAANWITCSG